MMAIIISIESSTKIGSVAIHQDGILVSELIVRGAFSHSRKLATMVQQALSLVKRAKDGE